MLLVCESASWCSCGSPKFYSDGFSDLKFLFLRHVMHVCYEVCSEPSLFCVPNVPTLFPGLKATWRCIVIKNDMFRQCQTTDRSST